jgi:hypothetical protein
MQSLPAEVLFKSPGGSLGPEPSDAPSVSEVEASSKACSWRDRLRQNGQQHIGEVEAALSRRLNLSQSIADLPQPFCDLPAAPLPSLSPGTQPIDLQVPFPCGADPENLEMGLQIPPSSGDLWSGEHVVETENGHISWQSALAYDSQLQQNAAEMLMDMQLQAALLAPETHWHTQPPLLHASHAYDTAYTSKPVPFMEAMPVEVLYDTGPALAQTMLMDYGLNREQIAAQLRAAAPCHYED